MAATGQVTRYNRFLPTLRKLGLTLPTPQIGNWAQLRTDVRGRSFSHSAVAA